MENSYIFNGGDVFPGDLNTTLFIEEFAKNDDVSSIKKLIDSGASIHDIKFVQRSEHNLNISYKSSVLNIITLFHLHKIAKYFLEAGRSIFFERTNISDIFVWLDVKMFKLFVSYGYVPTYKDIITAFGRNSDSNMLKELPIYTTNMPFPEMTLVKAIYERGGHQRYLIYLLLSTGYKLRSEDIEEILMRDGDMIYVLNSLDSPNDFIKAGRQFIIAHSCTVCGEINMSDQYTICLYCQKDQLIKKLSQ